MERTQGDATPFQNPERAEKHLGRGLEDVSHLFLSQASGVTSSSVERQKDPSGDVRPLSTSQLTPTGSAPFSMDRNQLVSVLSKSAGILEEGLRTIDADIPWEIGGAVDLVAVDRRHQLAIIDLDPAGNDALLLRGICHLDWFARNVPIIRRMYPAQAIDFGSEPRLFLIGPRFSPVFRCAAQRITCLRITCVTYNLVTLPGGTGIFFQHA